MLDLNETLWLVELPHAAGAYDPHGEWDRAGMRVATTSGQGELLGVVEQWQRRRYEQRVMKEVRVAQRLERQLSRSRMLYERRMAKMWRELGIAF